MINRRLKRLLCLSFKSRDQTLEVIVISAEIEQVASCKALHHPEMGPACGEHTIHLSATDDLLNSEQSGKLILGICSKQSLLAGTAEPTGTGSSAEAFQQRPAVSGRIKVDLNLGMSGMGGGTQVSDHRASGRSADKQRSMHRLDKRAFA